MTLIHQKAPPNPLKGWQVDPSAIRMVGHDLSRPECILAERDGSLWAADSRGGVMNCHRWAREWRRRRDGALW